MTNPTTDQANKQIAVNDIGTADDFLAAVEQTMKYFNDGDLISGTVVRIDRDEVLLDVGYKTEGVIPQRELSIKHDVDPDDVVELGDEIEALVIQKEDKEGRLLLSKKRAQYERAWGDVEKIKEEDGVVTGTVIEVVKGGLIVDIGLRGFLPASLIELRRVRDLTPYLNQEIEAKILELDKNRNNVVLSRRALLEQTQSETRANFLNQLQKGQVRKGVVSSIVNFGAFVRVADGIEGLVHISELSNQHIETADQVVSVGEELFVKIIDIDLERRRISLSLKQANEGVDPDGVDFDPATYGMLAEFDEQGNYKYPEGFNPETNEWMEGFEAEREAWEQEYAQAQGRWEAHKEQVRKALAAEPVATEAPQGSFSSESDDSFGTLADDESLAALREKLAGH